MPPPKPRTPAPSPSTSSLRGENPAVPASVVTVVSTIDDGTLPPFDQAKRQGHPTGPFTDQLPATRSDQVIRSWRGHVDVGPVLPQPPEV